MRISGRMSFFFFFSVFGLEKKMFRPILLLRFSREEAQPPFLRMTGKNNAGMERLFKNSGVEENEQCLRYLREEEILRFDHYPERSRQEKRRDRDACGEGFSKDV